MAGDKRRLPANERRAQLIDAALTVAAGGDLAAVSVGDIAAHARVSDGLLYHYFPTKQALVTAAIRRAADSLLEQISSAAGGDPEARLAGGLHAYLDHVQAEPTSWRALLQADTGELAAIGAEIQQTSLALLLDVLGIEAPSPALRVAMVGWLAFERGLCLAWLDEPEVPRTVIEAILGGTFMTTLAVAAEDDQDLSAALTRLALI